LAKKTRSGIKQWQKRNGHPETGELTEPQVGELKGDAEEFTLAAANAKKAKAKRKEESRLKAEKEKKIAETKRQDELLYAFKSDPSTKSIFEGNADDIVYLFNETGNSAYGIRDLDGKVNFEGGKVTLCSIRKSQVSRKIFSYVAETLKSAGIPKSQIKKSNPTCGTLSKTDKDLFVLHRGSFASLPFKSKDELLKLMYNKQVSIFVVYDHNRHLANLEKKKRYASEILKWVSDGSKGGYGLMRTGKGGDVCTIQGTDTKVVASMIADFKKKSPIGLSGLKGISQKNSLNAVFVLVKRGKCGYVFGRAGDLANLLVGMRRDKLMFSMHPDWADIEKGQSASTQTSTTTDVVSPSSKIEKPSKGSLSFAVSEIGKTYEVGDGFTDWRVSSEEVIIFVKWVLRNAGRKSVKLDSDALQFNLVTPNGNKLEFHPEASEAYGAQTGEEYELPGTIQTGQSVIVVSAFVSKRVLAARDGWKLTWKTLEGEVTKGVSP